MSADNKTQPLDPEDIEMAYERIRDGIKKTPITHSHTFSSMCGCDVWFKLENLQMTGSYKERGALNRLLALSEEEKSRGIITASAGNHAQAVAYHGRNLGISTKIVMPKFSPLVKVRSTRHWGAEVILEGETFDDAVAYSHQIVEEENRVYIHPFDDLKVVEGQATVGLEILVDEMADELDAILVPVGGGGLIAGLASYVKARKPHIKIYGVEEASCDSMAQALLTGTAIQLPAATTIADGIAVRKVSQDDLEIVEQLVDGMFTVNSDEIANAIMLMLEIEKTLIEAAAATPLAALINHKIPELEDKRVLCVVTGGNIDVNVLTKIINHGLTFDGRIRRFETVITDRPGGLGNLLGVFRELGANILEVHHHRFSSHSPVGQVDVSVTAETRDKDHVQSIYELLATRGYVDRD